jgi:hypothetical protein
VSGVTVTTELAQEPPALAAGTSTQQLAAVVAGEENEDYSNCRSSWCYDLAMAVYIPPGWPTGVHPPGSEDFEATAIAWLLDVVPPDFRLHGVLRRHPAALAAMARHHTQACVEGARAGYRTARTELGEILPPHAIDAVLAVYRAEGRRLANTAKAVALIEQALRGETA